MPFTAAHAVAALPFRKIPLPASALVVGCLSPDFEYFLRLAANGSAGHTLAGLFWLDLPLSLAVLFLWHRYAAHAVQAVAPGLFPIQHRSLSWSPLCASVKQHALVCFAVLIGAATHLLWDSFTHPTFWAYHHLPLLRKTLSLGSLGALPVYKTLQHGSTLLGMTVLGAMWLQWRSSHAQEKSPALEPVGWWMIGLATVLAAVRVLIGYRLAGGSAGLGIAVSNFVVTWMSSIWVLLVLFGALVSRHTSLRGVAGDESRP